MDRLPPFPLPFFFSQISAPSRRKIVTTFVRRGSKRDFHTDRGSQFRCPDFTLTLYQGEKWHQDPLSQGIQKQLLLETVDLVRELGGPNPHLLKSLQGPSPMNSYFGSLWPTLPKLWGPNAMLQCGMSPDSSRISFLGCKNVV